MARRRRGEMGKGYAAIGLYNPKFMVNLGGVLRAAHCYDAKLVVYTGDRYRREPTDTSKAYNHIPLLKTESLHSAIPFNCVPVGVDILDEAECLFNYDHPRSAFYIFGPEDGTLGKKVTDWCRDVIYIPTQYCMNLAAAVNVVLYDRMMKEYRKGESNGAITREIS